MAHLQPVPDAADTGEVLDDAPSYGDLLNQNQKLKDDLAGKLGTIGKLEKRLRTVQGKEPDAENVKAVLLYWRPRCMPKARIVAASERWTKVKARLHEKDVETGERYSVEDLQQAVDGALLSDYHREKGYLDATTIFQDSARVDRHRARLRGVLERLPRQSDKLLKAIAHPDPYARIITTLRVEYGSGWLIECNEEVFAPCPLHKGDPTTTRLRVKLNQDARSMPHVACVDGCPPLSILRALLDMERRQEDRCADEGEIRRFMLFLGLAELDPKRMAQELFGGAESEAA